MAVDPEPFTAKLAYARGLIQAESPNVPTEAPVEGKTVLIAAGSATSVTKKQMEVLCSDERNIRISVDPIPLISDDASARNEEGKAIEAACMKLQNEEEFPRAILFETALHGTLLNLDEEDAKRNYLGGTCADLINIGLGHIVLGVLTRVALGATAQCATASIITLLLCPFITAAFDKYMMKHQKGIYSPEGWAYEKGRKLMGNA